MKNIYLTILLSVPLVLFAQLPQSLLKSTERIVKFDDYEGSIYQSLLYKDASIIDEKSGTFDAKLRYNIHTDAIEHKKGDNLFTIVKNPTTHVRINEDYYYYSEFRTQRGIEKPGYYVLVEYNEKYRIYKRFVTEIREPSNNGSVNGTSEPGKIRINTTYYIEEEGTIMEFPMSKKAVLSAFSDKADELKAYMKKEKIKLRKEEGIIKLVSKYNALKNLGPESSKSLLTNGSNY